MELYVHAAIHYQFSNLDALYFVLLPLLLPLSECFFFLLSIISPVKMNINKLMLSKFVTGILHILGVNQLTDRFKKHTKSNEKQWHRQHEQVHKHGSKIELKSPNTIKSINILSRHVKSHNNRCRHVDNLTSQIEHTRAQSERREKNVRQLHVIILFYVVTWTVLLPVCNCYCCYWCRFDAGVSFPLHHQTSQQWKMLFSLSILRGTFISFVFSLLLLLLP